MKLRSMHAVNFCQHRDLKIEFPPGITGILGSNGAGKSNAVKAVRFAVIGDSGNAGAKVDDLNWRAAAEGASGSVELAFVQAGTEGVIKRFVNNARAGLTFGELKAKSVSAVNTEMARILGVPDRTVKDIVFVMQGAIEEILFERPAERAKKFQGLFGTENAERLRDLLLQEIGALPTGDVDERMEQVQKELDNEVDPQLRELTADKAQVEEALRGFDRDVREAVVAKYETADSIERQLNALNDRINTLRASVASERARAAAATREADELSGEVDKLRDRADASRARLASLDSIRRAHETHERLRAEAAELEEALRRPAPVDPGVDEGQLTGGFEALDTVRAALAPKRAFVAAFKGGEGTPKCPTCLQDVHDAGKIAAQFETEVVQKEIELRQAGEKLTAARAAVEEFKRATQVDVAEKDGARKRLQHIHGTLSTLGVTSYDAAEADNLQGIVAEYDTKLAELNRRRDDQARLAEGIFAGEGELRTLTEQQVSLQGQLQDRPTVDRYNSAKQALEMVSRAEAELANLEGQLLQLQRRRASILEELERLRGRGEKLEAVKTYKTLCERARTLFHRDHLPQMVTHAFLAGLNTKIAEYLKLFGAAFACDIKDDLSVVCSFPGTGEQAADRLSGGQRVVLGAFRFAIYNLFAGELGFMVLDEPTAFLDDDRIQSVVEVMQAVRRYAHQTGMQLVVITHEPELATAFDHVVHL